MLTWTPVTAAPHLGSGDTHLWRLDLGSEALALEALLSADEQARASTYAFADDRRRFTVARAMLRQILGTYLCVSPERVQFGHGPGGKPEVGGIHFNASHSGDLGLVAVSTVCVGVDVERIRPFPDALIVASSFLSAQDMARLRATPEGERERTFFELWTRHEARVKATGQGLTEARAVHDARTWDSMTLVPLAGYVASLVSPALGHLGYWTLVCAAN